MGNEIRGQGEAPGVLSTDGEGGSALKHWQRWQRRLRSERGEVMEQQGERPD